MSDDKTKRDVEVKAFESFEIKDESTGEVEAVIATLNVVDRDYEVITPSAIKSGAKVKMSSYGHDAMGGFSAGSLPVGKGTVHVEKDKAVFRGKIFTSTERGKETLAVLKEMGSEQEWSFGFRVLGSEIPNEEWTKQGARRILTKLDVFEVSPVIIGAGIGTRTVAAKEADEEAARAKAEADAEAAKKAEEEAAAAKKAEEDSAAEAKRLEEEAAAKAAEESEAKRIADEAAQKALALDAKEYHDRTQRAIAKMGL